MPYQVFQSYLLAWYEFGGG